MGWIRKNESAGARPENILLGISKKLSDLVPKEERSRWREDPVYWAENKLGEYLWSKQKEILIALAAHDDVSVKSCHGVGKTRVAALATLWWIDSHDPGKAFVVTTAPTYPQVKAVLWREIGRLHAQHGLPGRANQTELFIENYGKDELVAIGRKPSDVRAADAMQGIHAEGVLAIGDEACGLVTNVWDAFEAITTGDWCKKLMIGNPTDPKTEFFESFKPASGYHCITISPFDSPNFTHGTDKEEFCPEHVRKALTTPRTLDKMRKRWGEHSARYVSRGLGEFPDLSESDKFYPLQWILNAHEVDADTVENPIPDRVLSVDVGGGRDEDIIAFRDRSKFRILYHKKDPSRSKVGHETVQLARKIGVDRIIIDCHGVGAESFAIIRTSFPSCTFGLNVGDKPVGTRLDEDHRRFLAEDQWFDIKAELYDVARDWLRDGVLDLDIEDDDLVEQMLNIDSIDREDSKIQVESKKVYRRKYLGSPDRMDTLALSAFEGFSINYYAKPIEVKKNGDTNLRATQHPRDRENPTKTVGRASSWVRRAQASHD